MKTKIIYISGNEVFDMADIRAAFEEVRHALGLDRDTIMFGVPVDADNALGVTTVKTEHLITDQNIPTQTQETIPSVKPETPAPDTEEITQVDQSDTIDDMPAPKQKKSAVKRGRPRTKTAITTDDTDIAISVSQDMPHDIIDTPAVADVADAASTDAAPLILDDETPVIPILSVLASKSADTAVQVTDAAMPDITDDAPVTVISEDAPAVTAQVQDIEISAEILSEDIASTDDTSTDLQRVTIEDMITDDAPVAPVEKTLEQLLESMTPLREDLETDASVDIIPADDTDTGTDDLPGAAITDDADATLEQLAAEFAQNEDKIVSIPKPENHGKIGKLKNILPFKKVKRDDTGLMGDLFGWAGIAANDEDFSIPGFFTTAASKK